MVNFEKLGKRFIEEVMLNGAISNDLAEEVQTLRIKAVIDLTDDEIIQY